MPWTVEVPRWLHAAAPRVTAPDDRGPQGIDDPARDGDRVRRAVGAHRRRRRRRHDPRRRHAGDGRARLRRHAAGDDRRHGAPRRRGRAHAARTRSSSATCRGSATTSAPRRPCATRRALIRAGAGAVKLEGGRKRLDAVQAILDAEIPVMGHIGLTPQSIHALGGFKVQGKELDAAKIAGRRRGRARRGRLFRDRARVRSRRCGADDHRDRSVCRRSASARAATATARCSCGTTCSASPGPTARAEVRARVRGARSRTRPTRSSSSAPTCAQGRTRRAPRRTT